MNDQIYLGIKGKVLCIDKKTGREIWRTDVRRSVLVNVVVDGKTVLAYSNGHLFCLDADTGDLLWTNNLPGLGHGYCIIATPGNQQTTAAATQQIQAQTAAAAAVAASSAAAASGAS